MTTDSEFHDLRRDLWFGAIAVVTVTAALVLGQIATYPNLVPWYADLIKPSFNPPNWVFAPVWTSLYALMAFAVWRILRLPPSAQRRVALNLFFAQLALNAAWPWMFFGVHNPVLGLINIVPQLTVIVGAAAAFYRLDRMAAACLVPLALWVTFASALNFEIWRLNS